MATFQGDDCFCANETVLYTDTEYIKISDDCQKCSTNTGSCAEPKAEADLRNCAGYYSPFTCGLEAVFSTLIGRAPTCSWLPCKERI